MRRFWLWAGLTLVSGGVGLIYSAAVHVHTAMSVLIGLMIGGGIMAFEFLVVQSPVGARFRRLPLPIFIALVSVVWVLLIWLALSTVPRLFDTQDLGRQSTAAAMTRDMVFSFLVAVTFNAVIRVQSLIGPRVLANFLIGRYYRPLRENRVFLFLDLAGSTRMAEELGDVEAQTLIAQFFFDIAAPIAAHGGETHRYIGDEVVVTWTLDKAVQDARCLRRVMAIKDLIARRAPFYEARFGLVPKYRIGLHGGPVVASEVGDDKREIVYFGDTINTAARLQGLAKDRGVDIVISQALLDRIDMPEGLEPRPMAPATLAGKAEPMAVATFSIRA
jgi:adenylate cyclase